MNKIKLSELDQTNQLNDLDILEISIYENFEYKSRFISVENFRLSFGVPSHTIQSHTDTNATGSQLDILVDGNNADSLHSHDLSHDIQSHTDTNATGSQLNTLTDGSNADSLHIHDLSHDIQSHTDTNATGSQLDTLTNGSNADSLHVHDFSHTIQSHTDTNATGSQLDTLTNGSNADSLHVHTLDNGIIGGENLIIPVGTILEFLIDCSILDGWLLCDGSYLSKVAYPFLYEKLKDGGTECIYGENIDEFKLPDLRGIFVRGWAHGSVNDPDRSARLDRGDGITGDNVGTIQYCMIESHSHTYYHTPSISYNYNTNRDNPMVLNGVQEQYAYTDFNGGNETRPKNINVQYYIKF